jgi:hypothetical protein
MGANQPGFGKPGPDAGKQTSFKRRNGDADLWPRRMPDAKETPGVGIGNGEHGFSSLMLRGFSIEGGVAFEQKFAEGVSIAGTKCPGRIDFGAVFEARRVWNGIAIEKAGSGSHLTAK